MNNTQQQTQQLVQSQPNKQKTAPKVAKQQVPAANDEIAKIAQLGYN